MVDYLSCLFGKECVLMKHALNENDSLLLVRVAVGCLK